jgi:hypothetical protein
MKALALCKSQQIKAAEEKKNKNWKVTTILDHILHEKTLPSI